MTDIQIDETGVSAIVDIDIADDLTGHTFQDILVAYGDAVRNVFADLIEGWAQSEHNINQPIEWHEGMLDAVTILKKAELKQNPQLVELEDEDEQAF